MPSLKSLKVLIDKEFPEFETKIKEVKPVWGEPHLFIKKGKTAAASVFFYHKKVQIVPIGATWGKRFRQAFSLGQSSKYEEVAVVLERFLSIHLEDEVVLVSNPKELKRSTKGKRADYWVQIFVGFIFFGLAAYSYVEIRKIERLGEGEEDLEDLIYILYSFLGKNGTVGVLVAIGLYCVIESIIKLRKKASTS